MQICGFVLGRKTLVGLGLLIVGAVSGESAHAQWGHSPRLHFGHPQTVFPTYGRVPRGTGVYVNGHQLSWQQLQPLRRRFGYVRPGRYWLLRDGTYGLAGGPAMGNLYRPQRSYGRTRRRGSLLGGPFLTGGGVIGRGAIFRGGASVSY